MFTEFERDDNAESGVLFKDFVTAVGMFVSTNEHSRAVTVTDVAMAFNTTPELAREAAAEHPWLYVEDDGTIQSDGE